MGRKSANDLPPGIHKDVNGVFWATLEGEYAASWRQRYPERGRPPRRRAEDLREALKLQRQLIRDLEDGRDSQAKNPIVAEYVESWIEGRKLAESTIRRYRVSLNWQIKPLKLGRKRIQAVTNKHICEWVSELEQLPHHNVPNRVLDAYSIRNAFAVLRGAFNAAMRGDAPLIARNPCH